MAYAHIQRDEKARAFGQWVMIATSVVSALALHVGAQYVGPHLGTDITNGLAVLVGLATCAGAFKVGELAECWLTAKHQRSSRS